MIVIVPYRPAWPDEFAATGARLRAALGSRALAIHHIGSTAVPGLDAKDVIDIQVTVADLGMALQAPLASAGFEPDAPRSDHCPPGMALAPRELEKRFYRGIARAANLHVRAAGRFNQRYPLLCRDYLRSHPTAAAAYAEIKRQLATRFPADAASYYAVKDPVFDLIMAAASEWAGFASWQPPPSDA